MAQNDPSSGQVNRQEAEPPILDYRAPREDPGISKLQVVAGIFISTIILVAAVFFGVLGSLGGPSIPWAAIVIIGGALVGVIVWAVLLKPIVKFRGLAIGLWIGIGVTFLIEGICFGVARL